jgi:hypothetical protein
VVSFLKVAELSCCYFDVIAVVEFDSAVVVWLDYSCGKVIVAMVMVAFILIPTYTFIIYFDAVFLMQ